MDIKAFKLVNGEELIADVKFIGSDYLQVENCMILYHLPHPETGQAVPVFGDWPALAAPGQTLRIQLANLLLHPVEPHPQLVDQYRQNVTGLTLPPSTPKILLS